LWVECVLHVQYVALVDEVRLGPWFAYQIARLGFQRRCRFDRKDKFVFFPFFS